jgi:hypothetical protein
MDVDPLALSLSELAIDIAREEYFVEAALADSGHRVTP